MSVIRSCLVALCAFILPLIAYADGVPVNHIASGPATVPDTLVIIDASVEHAPELLPGIVPTADVVFLDAERDPIDQIDQILSEYRGLSSLHLVTHGSPGRLYLGATELSLASLNSHRAALTRWSEALAPGADVMLYGCEIAAGEGREFVEALADLLGADVAASTDKTASTVNGGDWEFEVATGLISTDGVFVRAVTEASSVVLALPAGFTNELVIQNLNQPVSMDLLPSGEMLILERPGTIKIMDPTQPLPSASVYLQLPAVDSGGEKGLLDIALDADFANNNYFYVYYHNLTEDRARISRFTHDVDHAHIEDEVVVWEDHLITSVQVISDHWGGGLDVGPDGYLYLTLGDKKDNATDAQDLTLSAGKIIRVDPSAVDTGGGWVQGADNSHLIPASNPFIDHPGGNLD